MRKSVTLIIFSLVSVIMMREALALDLGDFNVNKLIDMGKKAVQVVTTVPVEREVEIGRGMAASLLGAAPLVEDDNLQSYVNKIGQWLASQTERDELEWHFGVLDADTINAFAAPGGYIFVTRGLMRICNSESELAGVLAHEIGHVLQRHHLEAIRKQAARELAADLAGEAIRQQGFNAEPFIKTGMQLYARGLDREDELESDLIGVVIATRAGYEPYGLPRVLLSLNNINPNDNTLTLLTSTHPPTSERLEILEQKMAGKFEDYSQQPQVAERYVKFTGVIH